MIHLQLYSSAGLNKLTVLKRLEDLYIRVLKNVCYGGPSYKRSAITGNHASWSQAPLI